MKRLMFFFAALAVLSCGRETLDPASYVDPFIGTDFHGHAYPGASAPFGMVQLSPDTRTDGWDACSGYHYSDSSLLGFSHTHLSGTGCADLGDILFYPSVKGLYKSDGSYVRPAHAFRHEDEKASCGYYAVNLNESGISVELTATPRTGVHRYAFHGNGEKYILIDLQHTLSTDEKVDRAELRQLSVDEISGMRRTQGWVADHQVHFYARFSVPFESCEIVSDRQALLTFDGEVREVTVAVGLSGVSEENARENCWTEVPELDFDKVRYAVETVWKEEMEDIVVEGGSDKERTCFYTACYHSKLTPNVMNDVNGEYRRSDDTIGHLPEGKNYYSTLSLWDTFRTWHPLQTLLDHEFVSDMVCSMLDMYKVSGELPIWPLASGETRTMIGYHAVSVIADAYLRGIGGFDPQEALAAMVRSSDINAKSSDLYTRYGFIPADMKKESASCTLEYAYDDWAIARMAEKMGRQEIADVYYERAMNYTNLFDGKTRFFRGRCLDGTWTEFSPFAVSRDFTEATPWHYRFFVPHDIHGLIQLFGGREEFNEALDNLFHLESDEMDISLVDVTGLMGQYAHGNEPSHNMAYLYSYSGQAWKTQKTVRELLADMYSDAPDGIVGNEDCGQMSAWYIMSAAGIYPVCPGSGELVMTSPLFNETRIRLANGKELRITADDVKNTYIGNVTFNGKKVEGTFITYEQLMEGGELHFTLVPEPVKASAGNSTEPYSLSRGSISSLPYTTSEFRLFDGKVDFDLASATEGAAVRYTLDGTEPDERSTLYERPFVLTSSATVKAKAFKEGCNPSRTSEFIASKADYLPGKEITGLKHGLSYRYHAGTFSSTAQVNEAAARQTPVRTGVMNNIDISGALDEDHFAYIFEGYLEVPEKGVWEFQTTSDDGSVLMIDGRKVVDNDFGHAAVSATGSAALDAGIHSFRLIYFEDYEGQELSWAWRLRGEKEFRKISDNHLYHN